METTKVLTSLLVLTLTGPTLGYPFTRGVFSRTGGRGRDQVLDAGLGDYLLEYSQDEQYALPQYQPNKRYAYAAQRPRINAEALAALLPILTNEPEDDTYDYYTYIDDDGTWYDNTANDDVARYLPREDSRQQMLLNRRTPRYSVEDLETLEREAAMEDNTENQLQALLASKQNFKRTSMPVLGSRVAVAPRLLRKGQKEEAFDIPATSVRRPVFVRTVTTEPEEQTETQSNSKNDQNSSTQKPEDVKKNSSDTSSSSSSSSSSSDSSSNSNSISSSSSSNSEEAAAETATMAPYVQDRYEALKKYLDRERKARQLEDMENELREQRRAPQKRFITEQETLPQQLANLKKNVA